MPGELVVLTLTPATGADHVWVRAFDREIPVVRLDERSWRALIGIDIDVAPGTYTVWITARAEGRDIETTYDLTVKARRFATRTLRVDSAYVDPPAAMLERIQQEMADLERLWESLATEPLWAGRFVPPVPTRATSSFGSRSVINGEAGRPHAGVDFASRTGTPVRAPNAGRVVLVRSLYFSGNTVVIDHGLGLLSLFAHLSVFTVSEGEIVSTGQIVGRVGATGRATGPHLHWAVRANGSRIDPLSLLALLGR